MNRRELLLPAFLTGFVGVFIIGAALLWARPLTLPAIATVGAIGYLSFRFREVLGTIPAAWEATCRQTERIFGTISNTPATVGNALALAGGALALAGGAIAGFAAERIEDLRYWLYWRLKEHHPLGWTAFAMGIFSGLAFISLLVFLPHNPDATTSVVGLIGAGAVLAIAVTVLGGLVWWVLLSCVAFVGAVHQGYFLEMPFELGDFSEKRGLKYKELTAKTFAGCLATGALVLTAFVLAGWWLSAIDFGVRALYKLGELVHRTERTMFAVHGPLGSIIAIGIYHYFLPHGEGFLRLAAEYMAVGTMGGIIALALVLANVELVAPRFRRRQLQAS